MPRLGRAILDRGVLREPVALAREHALDQGVLRPALSLILFMALGLGLVGCSEMHGDAGYATVEKGFDKEMTASQRQAAIEDLRKQSKNSEN
jgi:hypothetical protein